MRDHDQVLTTERIRVMDDPAVSVTAALLGLAGFEVLAVADAGVEVEVLVETRREPVGCPGCGAIATAKDRGREAAANYCSGTGLRFHLPHEVAKLWKRPSRSATHRHCTTCATSR